MKELLKTDIRDHGVFRKGSDLYFEACRKGRDYVKIYRSPLVRSKKTFGAVNRVLQGGGDSTERVSAKRRTEHTQALKIGKAEKRKAEKRKAEKRKIQKSQRNNARRPIAARMSRAASGLRLTGNMEASLA